MKIKEEDFQDTLEFLLRKRSEGDEFIAFHNDLISANKEELFSFSEQSEVQKFCYEMSTDVDTYNYLAIRSAYRAMSEAVKNNDLVIEKDGSIDISLMVVKWYRRLETEQLNNNQNSKIMNQKNYEFLKDQVKYTGFGEGLANELKEKLEKQEPAFTLSHQVKHGNETANAILNFRKDAKSDMYYFNSFQVSLEQPNKEKASQTFYVGKENNYTFKEAYNLLCGRAVYKELTNKEDQKYNAWVKLDFKETDASGNFKTQKFNENYGFNLENEISKLSIKDLNESQSRERLMASLERGNRQSVTIQKDGKDQACFIEANPQFKSITIYDSSMRKQGVQNAKKEGQSESQGQAAKKESNNIQNSGDADGPEPPKPEKKKKNRQSNSL